MLDLDWFGDETDAFGDEVDVAAAEALVPFTTQPPSVWCEQNIYLPAGRSSMPGPLRFFPFQRAVIDAFADPSIKRVVVPKGSRTGYNTMLAAWQIYCAANSRDPIVSIHPVEKSSRTHEETIRGMLLNSPKLLRLIPDLEDQRWDHKRFLTGSELFFKEATKPSNFAEYSARNAAADEVDRPQWADGGESVSEGEKLDLLETRLASYEPFGMDKMVVGASPGTDATSRVWPRFMLTDQRKLFLPCHQCGEWDFPKWGGRETDHGVKWSDDPKAAVYVCEHCGGVWSEKDRQAALRRGEWRATSKDGVPGWVGFHMTGLMSPFWSLGDLASAFDKAAKMAAQGRIGSLQAFINTKLGETWKDRDAKAPAAIHELQERVEHYQAEVPAECLFVLGFADTQEGKNGEPGYHEVGFYGVGAGEQFWHIGQFVVREHGLDDDRHWDQLEALLDKEWRHASGRTMRAALVCVDSGSGSSDHSHRVIRFCNEAAAKKRMWYPTKGHSNLRGERLPTIWPTRTSTAKRGGYLYVVDTYRAKDIMYERLKREPGTPGSVHFPSAHIEGALPLDGRFFKRLTKERPKVVPGQDATSWAKQPKDQEPWDCLIGCFVGLEALYAKAGGNKLRERLRPGGAAPVDDGQVDVAPVADDQEQSLPEQQHMPPWKMTAEQRAAAAAQKETQPAAIKRRAPMVLSRFVSR